jgi:DNA helicase-2/ATP-dependent DNA helicase PcrA
MLQPGIGGGYAERIFRQVSQGGASLERALDPALGASLPPKVREGFAQFQRTARGLAQEERRDHPDLLIEEVLEKGYNKHVLLNFDNAQERLEDLRQLVNFAHTYKTLKDFLADVTLREGFKGESIQPGPDDESSEELVLSTIHQAKGLEWRAVFVIGLSEGQFPHVKALADEDSLEEERRLFYVAATRAKEELVLVHSMMRWDYNAGMVINRSSPFVAELPADAYDEVEVEESEGEETIYLD